MCEHEMEKEQVQPEVKVDLKEIPEYKPRTKLRLKRKPTKEQNLEGKFYDNYDQRIELMDEQGNILKTRPTGNKYPDTKTFNEMLW